jgi:hypothetical protein
MLFSRAAVLGALAITSITSTARAYPVDPAKLPVNVGQDPKADHDFTLAYDSEDLKVVYYAPKGGRVAIMNGQPLIGYAVLPSGEGFLNAQLEFGVFGPEKDALFSAITKAGYTPRPLPYTKTEIQPVTPGIDPTTGKQFCEKVTDPATGDVSEECDDSLYTAVQYSRSGPTLGENIAVSASLNKFGAAVYTQMLRGGNALQINMNADYYKAGTAFTATVTVNYSKLFESFHAYAAYHDGVCTDVQLEAFWKNEGLCVGKPASDCSVSIDFVDSRGNHINNATIDPDNKEAQEEVLQAVDRLKDQLEKEMLTPLGPQLGPLDTSKPAYGFKLNAQYEKDNVEKHATFQFKSPNGVNVGHTTIPTGVACILVSSQGDVSRNTGGDCSDYWSGSLGFADILAKQLAH